MIGVHYYFDWRNYITPTIWLNLIETGKLSRNDPQICDTIFTVNQK